MTRQTVTIDPAVAAILADGRERAEQRRMTPAKRRSAKRAARRTSVTLELDKGVVALVRQLAEAMEISPAGVVNRFLVDALERFVEGELGFEGEWLRSSRSPKYAWVVEVDVNGLRAGVAERLVQLETDGEF